MKIAGIILIILGLLGFIFGGITFTDRHTVAEMGDIEVHREERRTVPIGPIASTVAVIAGIVLVVADTRRPRV